MKHIFTVLAFCLIATTLEAKSLKSMMNSFMKESGQTSTGRSSETVNNGSYLEIVNPPEGNHRIKSFTAAKKLFKDTHYFGTTKTAYCNCPMTSWNTFTNKGCGYINEKYENQWHKIEAEHAVPLSKILENTRAYKVGEPSICGNKKGRVCAEKVYGFLASDSHILIAAEMELNRVHSNYQWAELGSQGKKFGTCDFYYQDQKVQPPQHLKGFIARAYMYVEEVYKVKVISNKNEKLFAIWAKYPPGKEECEREKQVIKYQGNENRFQTEACQKAGLW